MENIKKYHFKDIDADEEIIEVLHRNWFYLLEQFFFLFVVMLLLAGSTVIGPMLFPEVYGGNFRPFIDFLQITFLLGIWVFGWLIWVDYYFDIWIITSERVVNIEQKGMFRRRVSELTYDKIQDVTTDVSGFLPTMINFGDLTIQTAGEKIEFVFRTISDPYRIKSILMDLVQKAQQEKNRELGKAIATEEKIQK